MLCRAVIAAGLTSLVMVPFAGAATMPAGGAIKVWVASPGATVSRIVFTGAIGDYGTATSINKDGKADKNGDYVKIALKDGRFEVNAVALNKKTNNAPPTSLNKTTCSAYFSGSGPVTLFNGSGAYKGISGTIKITEVFAFVGPRYTAGAKKGQCNLSNSAQPVAVYSTLTGSGTVKYS